MKMKVTKEQIQREVDNVVNALTELSKKDIQIGQWFYTNMNNSNLRIERIDFKITESPKEIKEKIEDVTYDENFYSFLADINMDNIK